MNKCFQPLYMSLYCIKICIKSLDGFSINRLPIRHVKDQGIHTSISTIVQTRTIVDSATAVTGSWRRLFKLLIALSRRQRESSIDFWTKGEEIPCLDSRVAFCPALSERRIWSRAGEVIDSCAQQILISVALSGYAAGTVWSLSNQGLRVCNVHD